MFNSIWFNTYNLTYTYSVYSYLSFTGSFKTVNAVSELKFKLLQLLKLNYLSTVNHLHMHPTETN